MSAQHDDSIVGFRSGCRQELRSFGPHDKRIAKTTSSIAMNSQRHILFLTLIRVFLGSVFIVSGILKLLDLHRFTEALHGLHVIPVALIGAIAHGLPVLEVILGVLLLIGFITDLSLIVAGIILLVFLALEITLVVTGSTATCGCFGSLSTEPVGLKDILRDVILFQLLFIVFSRSESLVGVDSFFHSRRLDRIPFRFLDFVRLRKPHAYRALFYSGAILTSAFVMFLLLHGASTVVAEGKSMDSFSVKDLQGSQFVVNFKGAQKKTVLLIFSPECSLCAANMPNWYMLVSTLDTARFTVLGISLNDSETTRSFLSSQLVNYPVVIPVDPAFRTEYGITSTPVTVIVGVDGKIERLWRGNLEEKEFEEAKRAVSRGF